MALSLSKDFCSAFVRATCGERGMSRLPSLNGKAVIRALERAGFEVRDVQSLREHYALTLRHWVRNLEQNWEAAVAEVGEQRARVWRLYMAGSSVGFSDGGLNLHQVLGVVPGSDGHSGMPLARPV